MRSLAVCLLMVVVCANSQDNFDREKSAREYVQFLVLQLDQWSKEFPQQFYAALMRPPVDSAKLSEPAKAAAGELGDSLRQLAVLSRASDVMTSVPFRRQLDRVLASSKELNQAMGS